MQAVLYDVAHTLDRVRARFLRVTLGPAWLRRLFLSRPARLLGLFLLFEVVALALCAVVPLWQLMLGPLLFGFAHLAASVRYFHAGVSGPQQRVDRALRSRAYRTLVVASGIYTLWRIGRSKALSPDTAALLSEWEGARVLDGVFLVVVLGAAALLYGKKGARVLLGAAVAAPLCWGLWQMPRLTVGVLALGHNFVGFLYWITLATRRRERVVAVAALIVFSLITVVILGGALTPLIAAAAPFVEPGFGGVTFRSIGRLVAPGATPEGWMAATAAFAFGQSTHYFVWLKAIPDQAHTHEVPASFRQGLRLLGDDFGRRAALLVIAIAVGGGLLWLFLGFRTARLLYFALAGFHGYVELAGLGLLVDRGRGARGPPDAVGGGPQAS